MQTDDVARRDAKQPRHRRAAVVTATAAPPPVLSAGSLDSRSGCLVSTYARELRGNAVGVEWKSMTSRDLQPRKVRRRGASVFSKGGEDRMATGFYRSLAFQKIFGHSNWMTTNLNMKRWSNSGIPAWWLPAAAASAFRAATPPPHPPWPRLNVPTRCSAAAASCHISGRKLSQKPSGSPEAHSGQSLQSAEYTSWRSSHSLSPKTARVPAGVDVYASAAPSLAMRHI